MRIDKEHALALLSLCLACGDSAGTSAGLATGGTDGASTSTDPGDASGPSATTGNDASTAGSTAAPADPWEPVRAAIEASDIAAMAVIVGDAQGVRFVYEKGGFGVAEPHRIGSASKWYAAAAILELVEDGRLDLGDAPQTRLPFWTSDPGDPRSQVTLEQLLSFTAGFDGKPNEVTCDALPTATMLKCAEIYYDTRFSYDPGSTYYYGPVHMHIAATMAELETGQTWNELFSERVAGPAGMTQTIFDTPSLAVPRVAGGATSTAEDYARFLAAVLRGDLTGETFAEQRKNRVGPGVAIAYSPLAALDWRYGLGVWRECPEPMYGPACEVDLKVSSTGAYGWHPWIDPALGYYGVLAMEEVGADLAEPVSLASIELAGALKPLIEAALPGQT